MITGWHAWFSGGREFSSLNSTWALLPTTGALVFMLYFKDGTRRIMHGNDRYFWQDNGSTDGIYANTDEPVADIVGRYPRALIIEGELVSDVEMSGVMELSARRKSP